MNTVTTPTLHQAPLAGYSCAPLRVLAEQWGQPDYCYTEMLSAHHLTHSPTIAKRFWFKDPREGRLIFQLSGTDPLDLAKATERVLAWGADGIDLNCGCPVAKIRKKGAGSKLLEDPNKLKQLVHAIQNVSPVPVSIKIRVDGDMPTRYSLAAALAAQEAGVSWITIHGRHWTDDYDVPCRREQIAEIAEALTIPVIANGDAKDTDSVRQLLAQTGAQGVMIARASVGQPWLFAQIRAELAGKTYTPPPLTAIGQLFLQHLQGLIELEGEKNAVLQSRKLIKYYARPLPHRMELVMAAQQITRYADMEALATHSFVEHQTLTREWTGVVKPCWQVW